MRSRIVLLLASIFLVTIASIAYAKSIEDSLGGQIILTTKAIPAKLTSVAQVKGLSVTKFSYEKEESFNVNYLIFLKKPMSSSGELSILDITDGLPGNVKLSDTYFTTDRENRIHQPFPLTFDAKQLPGNRKYRVVLSHKGSVVAKADFYIKAKPQKFDGKVEFTEEEAKKKD
jgi:hypothetical protein